MASCKVRGGFTVKNDTPFVRMCQVYTHPNCPLAILALHPHPKFDLTVPV